MLLSLIILIEFLLADRSQLVQLVQFFFVLYVSLPVQVYHSTNHCINLYTIIISGDSDTRWQHCYTTQTDPPSCN